MNYLKIPPYYDENFFGYIKEVKLEGLLNVKTMTSGMWYRVLLENHVTHEVVNSSMRLKPCKAEIKNPEVDWEKVNIMRKSRHGEAAQKISSILNFA